MLVNPAIAVIEQKKMPIIFRAFILAPSSPRNGEFSFCDDPALAGQVSPAGRRQHDVRVRPFPVQREQIDNAALFVILLDDSGAVHDEHADVTIPQGVFIAKHCGAVLDIRLHTVALNFDREHGPFWISVLQGVILVFLTEDRGSGTGGKGL